MLKRLIGLGALVLAGLYGCGEEPMGAAVPEGYQEYMVFVADGVYDMSDPDYEVPSADWFYLDVLGYTQEQMDARYAEAVAFFGERFGLDLNDPEVAQKAVLFPFAVDPRNKYRAVTVSGDAVGPEGWEVRDGGWLLLALDAAGLELGGEFQGVTVPAGPVAAFGDYSILTDDGVVNIPYKAQKPFSFSATGDLSFFCELDSPEFGTGYARGITIQTQYPDGTVGMSITNVISFR